jgi:hypothetical protein
MLRKLILTETEKKQISSLHHLINEEDGFATLQGYVKYKTNKVPNSQVKLFQNEKIIKGATSDENGFFKIENIPLGKYAYKITNKVEGYEDVEEEIDLTEPKVYNVNYFFRDTQIIRDVSVPYEVMRRTFLDVSVFDSDGKPLGPSKIEVFDSNGKPLIISKNTTDDKGVLNFIEISDANSGFEIPKDQKQCEKKVSVSIRASYNNLNNLIPFELCIFNGRIKNENGVEIPTRYFGKNADGEVVIDTRATNIVKINLNTLINYQIRVRDEDGEEALKTATVKLFADKEGTKLINQGNSPLIGEIKREKLEDGDFEDTYKIYYKVNNDGYEPKSGKINVSTKKNNNTYVDLKKIVIKPPKPTPPPKPLSERECIRLTMRHYRNMENVDAGNITISELGGVAEIKKNAEVVKACYVKYMKEYPRRMEKTINRLKNVQSELDFFKLRFTNQEIRSIYGESRTMLLKNTIRKVVSESVENKSEKILIEERLKFSLTGLNKKNSSEVKRALRNERYSLINFGYNKELVRESFLDVMKGLYGNDETNVLTDIKTRLGQRIADQVKNKQEEHEMILSAFNELSEDMIERAIKENRVDELSTEIATKALEIYKTQFGTEGLSGIMIASVDENKFKQEVAKLIEPAIKEITTKMDEKLKQVQDVVSGGINPTA